MSDHLILLTSKKKNVPKLTMYTEQVFHQFSPTHFLTGNFLFSCFRIRGGILLQRGSNVTTTAVSDA